MLLPKLTSFTYMGLRTTKYWQSKNHLFWLKFLKLLIVDVVDLLVPQVDVRFDVLSFCKHQGTNTICFEDKHPPMSVSPVSSHYQSTLVLDEVVVVIKSDLHALINNMSIGNQVLCNCQDMQHISHQPLLSDMVEWYITHDNFCYSRFSKLQTHSTWFVIWFDVPKSMKKTSFTFVICTPIFLFALCFITSVRLISAQSPFPV